MSTSGSLTALATALAEAQGELKDAAKSSENPHFRSKYADLAEVLQTVRPVLSRHGLALVQTPGQVHDGKLSVTTMLLHKSGEWIQDTFTIPIAGTDPQKTIAALTYARRGAVSAITGLAQDDDDGETATGRGKAPKVKASPAKPDSPPVPPATPGELKAAFAGAQSKDDLKALAPRFAALPAEAQAEVLPDVKAARARLGL